MTSKRNLRSHAIVLGKSNEDIKKNSLLSTGKLLCDKENQLVNLNTKIKHTIKDVKRCQSRQSTSTNIKTWPLTNILNEKNSNINTCHKILAAAQKKEKQSKQTTKKEIKRFKKKTTAALHVNKQKHNQVLETDENDIQSKECKESTIKMKMISCKEKVNNTEDDNEKATVLSNINNQKCSIKKVVKLNPKVIRPRKHKELITKIQPKRKLVSGNFNKENLSIGEKATETETSCKNKIANIPIWRKHLDVNKSNQNKKRQNNVDVYDMSQDEELMSDKTKTKKKRILHQKKSTNNYGKKKCQPLLYGKEIVLNNNKSSKAVDLQTLKLNQEKSNVSNTKLAIVQIDEQVTAETLPADQNTNNNNTIFAFLGKNNMQDTFTTFAEDDVIEIVETGSDFVALEPKLQTVTNWADELEKSFLVPKMTSTPDTIHLKTIIPNKKHKVVTNISNITTTINNPLNTTVTTPASACDNIEGETDEDIGDITLFDSPIKKDENTENKPKKTIQINLFEILHSPSSVDSLEDSVLLPHKAYCTPDNFKTHLARTKRTAENLKKEPKKSKQEMLCEKLTQHFDEIEDTELYIE